MQPRHIVISGASGGLGGALARHYAGAGIHLTLLGRDRDRLEAVGQACTSQQATADLCAADVTDTVAMAELIQRADDQAAIDLVIAGAGVSGEVCAPGTNRDRSHHIIAVNVTGTLNTVEPVLPRMIARRHGAICIIASLAGLRGIARGPVYSASKAALITLGQGWRDALSPHDVGVTVACPGYLLTAMTANHSFKMPFAVSPDDAAETIAKGVARNRGRVTVPAALAPVGWAFSALPARLTAPLLPGRGRPIPPVNRRRQGVVQTHGNKDHGA